MKNKFNHLGTVLIVLLVFSFATLALTSCDPGTQAPKNAAVVPTASRAAGTIPEGATVELSTLTPDATIYYSTNGADPVKRGVKYSKPINISQTTTIKAVAVKPGMATSDVFTAVYTPEVSVQKVVWLNNLINQESFPQAFDYTGGGLSFTGNYRPDQSWDCYGWGDDGKLYFGYTTYNGQKRNLNDVAVNNDGSKKTTDRGGSSQEDFLVFCYDPATGITKYLDSYMTASRRAGNLREHDGSDPTLPHSEETPKGHTRFVNIGDGYLYMASQPFHDWKNQLTRSDDVFPFPLEDFRGGKLFRLDLNTGLLTDMTATMTGTPAKGVAVEHEGIIALDWIPSLQLLVGLTHPLSNLVFIDPAKNELVHITDTTGTGLDVRTDAGKIITVGREIVIDDINQKIYVHRGQESNSDEGVRPVYVFDWATKTFSDTGSTLTGGMWGGAVTTPDGKVSYVTHNSGHLAKFDFAAGTISDWGRPNGANNWYWTIPSESWTKLYWVPNLPSAANNGLWEYDLATKTQRKIFDLGSASADRNVNTGQKDLLRDGKLYHMSFGDEGQTGSWTSGNSNFDRNARQARIYVYDLDKIYADLGETTP